jgi:cytochrome c-type biogenesis protein CcmH/NrfG
LAFGAFLVPVLIGVALFFGWRQLRALRSLRTGPELDAADRAYVRSQAYRRLVGSVLLLVLAGLLAGSFFLEAPLQQVHQERAAQTAHDPSAPAQAEHKDFLRQFAAYWIAVLLVLMLLLALVAADVWAIARFGQRHRRQLRDDLRAMLASEVARIRRQGNGRH